MARPLVFADPGIICEGESGAMSSFTHCGAGLSPPLFAMWICSIAVGLAGRPDQQRPPASCCSGALEVDITSQIHSADCQSMDLCREAETKSPCNHFA